MGLDSNIDNVIDNIITRHEKIHDAIEARIANIPEERKQIYRAAAQRLLEAALNAAVSYGTAQLNKNLD